MWLVTGNDDLPGFTTPSPRGTKYILILALGHDDVLRGGAVASVAVVEFGRCQMLRSSCPFSSGNPHPECKNYSSCIRAVDTCVKLLVIPAETCLSKRRTLEAGWTNG